MRKLNSILNSALMETISKSGLSDMPVIQAANLTESPIEAQLMVHITRYDFIIGLEKGLSFATAKEEAKKVSGRVIVFPQVWVEDCRPDFVFMRATANGVLSLVVEADGKDWHYDSARAISEDNRRMAIFAKNRIHTMRFLGQEIWKDCESVIGHIRDFFDRAD